ncbi:maltase A1-like [Ostrinia furnacalis]|uniref:maltase A1-like n=1 Tax=Ostrinia furnacalis TaxID=93504 RepID=UPI0010406CA3|nr:maltase A1-like [Ostrinia furnacalis]
MWFGALALFLALHSVAAGPWWANVVYYRVLVDSFKDGDGDGLGDLSGATKQISYVRALGADAMILSPLSAKNTDCSKPGVLDFAELDPRYGNMGALTSFLEKAAKVDLKIVISLYISTISTASEWFNSSASKVTGFDDRLVWQAGSADQTPPVTNGVESWIWNEDRSAYFAAKDNEAVVNFCSEAVAAGLSAAQCAWLRRGFSGVLLNPDFPFNQKCGEKLLRKMTAEAMTCARSSALETPVILVESSLDSHAASGYYADGGVGANSVLSAALAQPDGLTAPDAALAFYGALLHAPQDTTPTWITSAPSQSRIATRYGSEMVDAVNLLALILPGAVVIQQGDELGVADTILEWAASTNTCYPGPAVPAAAPFPWSDAANGGFTTGEPWMPLAPNYRYANAKTEFANNNSHVGVMRTAAAMRTSPAIGPHVDIKRLGNALAVLRWGGPGSLLVVVNLGRDHTEVKLSAIFGLPTQMTVAASSAGSSLSVGSHLPVDKTLKLAPGETLLLAGGPRHCGGPGPVDKITSKLAEGWQKLNQYFNN